MIIFDRLSLLLLSCSQGFCIIYSFIYNYEYTGTMYEYSDG